MDPRQKAYDFVAEGGEKLHTGDGTFTVSQLMERFLFDGALQHSEIGRLSGGERRRLYLLRILMGEPNVLFLDEPTNDLDADRSDEVFDRFRAFVADGDRSVVVVTHDEAYACQADEVYVLEEGKLARREEVASC